MRQTGYGARLDKPKEKAAGTGDTTLRGTEAFSRAGLPGQGSVAAPPATGLLVAIHRSPEPGSSSGASLSERDAADAGDSRRVGLDDPQRSLPTPTIL